MVAILSFALACVPNDKLTVPFIVAQDSNFKLEFHVGKSEEPAQPRVLNSELESENFIVPFGEIWFCNSCLLKY